MRNDPERIEKILEEGKNILSARPELAEMSLHDMIDALDDGTQQMIRNRWGAAAWQVVKSINNFELKVIIEQLSEVKSGILTYEYTGYLLQKEYHINLEALILEADLCGKFDKIVVYVETNLVHEHMLYEQNFLPILNMMEKHKRDSCYRAFLTNYANHIVEVDGQHLTEMLIDGLDRQVPYDFMYIIRWAWYKKASTNADAMIGRLLKYGSIGSQKTAINFLETSMNYGTVVFEQYFPEIESLLIKSDELWSMLITLFVKYIIETSTDKESTSKPIYHKLLAYLEKTPSDSLEAKRSFVEALQWREEIPEALEPIFHEIISHSFGRDKAILVVLDSYLYRQLEKGKWKVVLKVMQEVFSANNYIVQYHSFFENMESVCSGLRAHIAEVTAAALDYMLCGGMELFFFGLGLFQEVGNLQKLYDGQTAIGFSFAGSLDDTQLIRLMKGIFYYNADSKKSCYTAFQLLLFSSEPCDIYLEFCINEVYKNYPATMNEAAAHYKAAKDAKQVHLAAMVTKIHEQLTNERKMSYEIRDLQASREHQYLYRKAEQAENRRINKSANKKYVFAQLFSTSILKYGIRNAYVVDAGKKELSYQVNPYMKHQYEIELPTDYVNDPVDYELARRRYLEEVRIDASGHKRLSDTFERER